MLRVNGFAAFLGREDITPHLYKSLNTLSHRAWSGCRVITVDGASVDELSSMKRLRSKAAIGACLPTEEHHTREPIVWHGELSPQDHSEIRLKISRSLEEADLQSLAEYLKGLDTHYVMAALKEDALVCARDSLGVKPIYLARGSEVAGIASEPNTLLAAGLSEVRSLRPGYIYKIGIASEQKIPTKRFQATSAMDVSFNQASSLVLELLSESVQRRLRGKGRVAIGLSGGLDSSLLCLLSSHFADVEAVAVFVRGSRDEDEAVEAAKALGVKIHTYPINEVIIKERIKEVSKLNLEGGPMHLSIGLAVHLAGKKARNLGFDCLMLGQLADELFGGYAKYLRALEKDGEAVVERMMRHDVTNAYRLNFERDERVASPNANLLLPYAGLQLVDYVMRLPIEFKVDSRTQVRKKILRRVASEAGLPESLVSKPKRALQFSSGLQKLVSSIR